MIIAILFLIGLGILGILYLLYALGMYWELHGRYEGEKTE